MTSIYIRSTVVPTPYLFTDAGELVEELAGMYYVLIDEGQSGLMLQAGTCGRKTKIAFTMKIVLFNRKLTFTRMKIDLCYKPYF